LYKYIFIYKFLFYKVKISYKNILFKLNLINIVILFFSDKHVYSLKKLTKKELKMEFLILTLFLISGLILYIKPQMKKVATSCLALGCVILVALEFYVNLWVVLPIGNF